MNCHASTETSDLLGGFRPVRGRPIIVQDMVEKARSLIQNWLDISFNINDIVPSFIIHSAQLDSNSNNAHEHAVIVSDSQSIPHDAPKQILDFSRALKERHHQNNKSISDSSSSHDVMSTKKKRKLSNGKADSASTISEPDLAQSELLDRTFQEIEILFQKFSSLFEWVDGPLVCSMKDGNMLLLDEMSLAEDAVLERLNSVLEPSRTLVLAEKGGEGPSCVHESEGVTQVLSSEIRAHENFRIFATMNPGGDFGKRELSPALRSRFTEIWVPAVSDRADIDLVLERSLSSCVEREMIRNDTILKGIADIRKMMLDYVDWFNVTICDDPNSFCNDFKLSLRDVLSWARFIADVYLKAKSVDQWSAYAHGASLMHLDGLGLGTGVSSQDALVTRNKAKNYLHGQITSAGAANVIGFQNELEGTKGSLVATTGCFGVNPFIISTGNEQIPEKLGFNMLAPTTGMNLRRVLRALQISKPVLLEGSPGVGKTR